MQKQTDYYETLGVDRKATPEEIRKTYRRLARKYHPDLNPGDKSSEDRFKTVQEAYDILSDPKKRAMFDQYGVYSENGFPGAPATPGQGDPGMGFGGFDFSEFMSGQGARRTASQEGSAGGFRDIFSQMFGKGGRPDSPASEKAQTWNMG